MPGPVRENGFESVTIVGISSNDQQSLIQQPKGILKTTTDHSRYTESSMDVYTGQQRPGDRGQGYGMVGAGTHRSLAESSASGVSQVNTKDDTSRRYNVIERFLGTFLKRFVLDDVPLTV